MALGRLRAVTLDALGTLVELDRPAERLTVQLRERGLAVDRRQAAAGLREEIAFYRDHHDEGVDGGSLERLRARCAARLRAGLERTGVRTGALADDALAEALLAALRFRAFADAPAALRGLRAAGVRLVVVSNWDVSLHDALRATGLRALVDGALSSAEAGARKPAPAIFAGALALAGDVEPAAALHAGDSPELDVAGALAAGMRAALVARSGCPPPLPAGVPVLASLDGLRALAT